MKKHIVYIVLMLTGMCNAQFGPRQIINENASTVRVVRAADFDNDGDQDVVVAAFDIIAWYENMDGDGTFSAPISIQEGKGQSFSLFPADIDGDSNVDIVVSYFDDDEVAWYRNLGDGTFSLMNLISFNLQNARGVYVSDLDGDADLDIVLGVSNGNGLYWIENLDGQGTFGPRIIIDVGIVQARTQIVGDIDGDGDDDILTNSSGSYFLSWFENVDGLGNFTAHQVIEPSPLYENYIDLADIDDDDDLDIISEKGDQVIWRENLDGLGTFSDFMIISDQVSNPHEVKAGDFDNNSTMDVVSVSGLDNKVAWYKNEDGLGTFGVQNVIDDDLQSPRTVYPADLDGDGDLDILSAALTNDNRELVWYENLTILSIDDQLSNSVTLYPNPVTDRLKLDTQGISITQLTIHDILGRQLLQQEGPLSQVDVSRLPSGMLFVSITTESGVVTQKVVKE